MRMVEVKIFQDGKLESESKGDFAVCIISARTGVKGELSSEAHLAGKFSHGAVKTTVARGITRLLARACRTKGKNMDKACRIMAGFTTDVMENGAENILSVYMDEED